MFKSPHFSCLLIIRQQHSPKGHVHCHVTILYPFLASPHHCKVCMLSLHLENRILEYNSSLGCHLGYYFPLFKTLETRRRINAVVVIGEELVITVDVSKWYHTFKRLFKYLIKIIQKIVLMKCKILINFVLYSFRRKRN